MIYNAEERQADWFRDPSCDVCVVGSGPAGITIARALAGRGRTVALFEGGGENPSERSQEIYEGDVVGREYWPLNLTRVRCLGGASNHWGGICRELDASDFEPRPANPKSGWPITKADLEGYAAEADDILDLPAPRPVPAYLPSNLSPFTPMIFRFSPRTRFGAKFREELAQSLRIKLYLNANLVDIKLDDARRSVLQVSFRSFDKEGTFTVKAKYFVLCLGGIENPRILLNCQGGISSGIGNQYGIVGRYFGDHLHFTLGEVLYKKTPPARLFVGPTTELMDSSKTLNFGLRLEMPEAPDRMLRTIACSTSFTERLVRAMGKRPRCEPLGLLRIAAEQALNPNSRVELTRAKDRFGIRRVALNWQLSDTDYRTLRVAATEWAKFVAKQDLGRVRLDEWVLNPDSRLPSIREDEVLGNHHLCTTRMSSSPKEGVVDGNCRVHDLENLYIGGSSVFATGGASNPTYTIVQLALRLADHLNQRLG